MKRMIDYKEFFELQQLANNNEQRLDIDEQRLDHIEGAYTYFNLGLDSANFDHLLPSEPEDLQPQTIEIGDTVYIEGVSATLDADIIKEIFDSNLVILDCGDASEEPTIIMQRQYVDEESAALSPRIARFKAIVTYGATLYIYTMNVAEYDETSEAGGYIAISCASSLSINELTSFGSQITALKPVVEDMSGYTLRNKSAALQNAYLGVVKNGNKLTFALSFELSLSEQPSYNIMNLASFYIPTEIANKLLANNWSGLSSVVNAGTISAISAPQNNGIVTNYYVQKASDSTGFYVQFNLITANLILDTNYKIRIEQTYLLSANLVE